MKLSRIFAPLLVVTAGLGAAFAASAGRYERPDYTLVERIGDVEVREYAPRLLAEVVMSGERDSSAGDAFGVLANYIFSRDTPSGEAIGMTVPVGQYREDEAGSWRMWFFMPSRYTLETLPPVNDPRIQITPVPTQRIAAMSFSGRMNTADFTSWSERLLVAVEEAGLAPVGAPTLAVYNGPFTPGPFRHNEVLVVVE